MVGIGHGTGVPERVRSEAFAHKVLARSTPTQWSRVIPLAVGVVAPLGMGQTEIRTRAPTAGLQDMRIRVSAGGRPIRGASRGLRSGDTRVWLC